MFSIKRNRPTESMYEVDMLREVVNFSEAYTESYPFLGFICSTSVGIPGPLFFLLLKLIDCIMTKSPEEYTQAL